MSTPPPIPPFTSGAQLYKYALVRLIGKGSFGEVWLANDQALKREYAIKILKPGISVDDRLREAQIGNRLSHENLVHVHQADVVNVGNGQVVIIAMDHHANGSIESLANHSNFLTLPDALRTTREILQGLEHLHAQSFIHNDIKPANILLGGRNQAMLSDYGIAGISTQSAPVPAPSAYLLHRAPEVAATGTISVSSDIFQTGVTLARLLMGIQHFRDIHSRLGSAEYNHRIASGTLLTAGDFPNHIPSRVRSIILKAIHPDPAKRQASALEMRRSLEKLSFPGYWTVDHFGNEVGKSGTHEFRYTTTERTHGSFDVVCERTAINSGRTQRVNQYCATNLTKQSARTMVAQFKKFVIRGK